MFVSVIIPNYCHSCYLDQRVKSILEQSYQDFEIIILDDCSLDNGASKSVIERYRTNTHVSRIIYNEINSGSTFKQWDKGINLAKGDLIWIAESDDYCEPTLLGKLVKEFKRDPKLTLAYTLSERVDDNGNKIEAYQYKASGVTRLKGADYVRRYMTFSNHCVNASACLFKKETYNKIDKTYTEYKASGDRLFWVEMAEHGNVAIVNQRLNHFRRPSESVIKKALKEGLTLKEFKHTYDYIDKHFNLGGIRKRLVRLNILYQIERNIYQDDTIKQDLNALWGSTRNLYYSEVLIVKIVRYMQHKWNLYL